MPALPHSELTLAHDDQNLLESLAWFGARVKLLNLQVEVGFWEGSRQSRAPEMVAKYQLELDQWCERLTTLGLEEVVAEHYRRQQERGR